VVFIRYIKQANIIVYNTGRVSKQFHVPLNTRDGAVQTITCTSTDK